MRIFRAATALTYENVRAELDRVWGYPNPETKTATAIPPASEAPTDAAGRVYLIASPAECDYPAIADRLPALLAAGLVEEVTPAAFAAKFPPPF